LNKKLISKALAICVAYLIFYIMMSLANNPTGSAPSISQALKWLSFGVNEKYGVLTLIVIAFSADSFFKRIL